MPHIRVSAAAHFAHDIQNDAIKLEMDIDVLTTKISSRRRGPSKKDFLELSALLRRQARMSFALGYAIGQIDEVLELRQLNVEALKYV